MTPAVCVQDLSRTFRRGRGSPPVQALRGVSLTIAAGETLGVVGESGCGKSTLARLIVRLDRPTEGSIELLGHDVTHLGGGDLRRLRRSVQLVFQDPYASLNPRRRVGTTLEEVLKVHRLVDSAAERAERVEELLVMVGLDPGFAQRYPAELSGGQRQRVGIARALAVEPSIIVFDEAVSALDVSVQAEIINLMVALREKLALTYVFISHDLGVVRHLADRIAVMYVGTIQELGTWEQVADRPVHPYTRALLSAVPEMRFDGEAGAAEAPVLGEIPNPADPPSGCAFHPRCPHAVERCAEEPPALRAVAERLVACHRAEEIGAR
ncbi:ABC transporter ATP-binding protein [Candidatus Poriferisocius sp.]|uniref:ABC transporter ATP-binding protein n=1 Tax=Candidatus Poriferisocius sp. TaxID=3101276 RepID=UPI003B5C8610